MPTPLQPFADSPATTAEQEAYEYILQRIRHGTYGPGDRLKPEDIASAIDMSRMPVREAFRRLATEGLLVLRPNRGAVVVTLTLDDIREAFEIREVLEGLAMRTAVDHFDARAHNDLEHLLEQMEYARKADTGAWLAAHRSFHEYLCALSKRQRLMRQIGSLHTALEPYLRLWLIHADQPLSADVQNEHREIVEAVASGDAARAETTMRAHIRTTTPDLTHVL